MRQFFQWVTDHPVPVLISATVVALFLGLTIFGLTRDTSPDAFIPADHPALALKRTVEQTFQLKEPIAVGVIRDAPGGVFHPETLALLQRLSAEIQALPGVNPEEVLSLATESGVYFEEGLPGSLRRKSCEDAAWALIHSDYTQPHRWHKQVWADEFLERLEREAGELWWAWQIRGDLYSKLIGRLVALVQSSG